MMNPDRSSEDESSAFSRAPLISIGSAILAVLMVPVFLYSMGPEGPIKVVMSFLPRIAIVCG